MKLLEVYKLGIFSLFRIMILILFELVFLMILIATIPIWWLKCIQYFLASFGDLSEKVMYY